ncbi:MAG: Fic family protein [Bacteriovoracaceae bacterium]|nr:Fic family protein [Bacteriovoracaceae bacterium]
MKTAAFYYSTSDRTKQKQMSILKKQKLIRKIGPRLYTSLPKKEVAKATRKHWSEILSNLFPNAFLTHRSALEYKPSQKGVIYLTANTQRDVNYPGLIFKFMKGPKVLESDVDFIKNLKVSSFERALLENLSIVKSRKEVKTLPRKFIEDKLELYLHHKGEKELNLIRDKALTISKKIGLKKEFDRLNSIIGALLNTHDINILKSAKSKARALSVPYDADSIVRLEVLFSELKTYPLNPLPKSWKNPEHWRNKAFIESYFSNYIEGTTFEIEEAEEIIFDKIISKQRPKDAHDIYGTFEIVSDPNQMLITPVNADNLISILKNRHKTLMAKRPEALPGKFKLKPNRAGNTHFVHPDLLTGTLLKGFDYYKVLDKGLARSIFMMFLITEIHPFADGNGRVARIMMNAELVSQNLSTIIIPNVYREDYLGTLRAMTRRERPGPLIKMLILAQKFSHLDFSNYPKILKYIEEHNWFAESKEAKIVL